jgi:hypothetical protein
MEHVAYEASALSDMQAAVAVSDYPGSILAAMLQYGQRIVNRLADRLLSDDRDDPAHALVLRW